MFSSWWWIHQFDSIVYITISLHVKNSWIHTKTDVDGMIAFLQAPVFRYLMDILYTLFTPILPRFSVVHQVWLFQLLWMYFEGKCLSNEVLKVFAHKAFKRYKYFSIDWKNICRPIAKRRFLLVCANSIGECVNVFSYLCLRECLENCCSNQSSFSISSPAGWLTSTSQYSEKNSKKLYFFEKILKKFLNF